METAVRIRVPPGIWRVQRVAFRVDAAAFRSFVSRLREFPVFDENGNRATTLDKVDHGLSVSVYFCDPWGNYFEITTYDVSGS